MTDSIRLSDAPNFRDLAGHGYTTADGRTVRRGRVFRSDHLGNLLPADLSTLSSTIGDAVRVLDLRGVTERRTAPCAIPGATVHSLAIEPTIVQKLTDLLDAGAQLTEADTVALMQDTYRGFVRGNTRRFAELFGHVLDARQDAPIVFHCTAGKDRTGFAAALLLLALDVPHEVVLHDYLLTNERFAGKAPNATIPPQIAHVLHRVQADFLHAALDAVEQDYGSVDDYLRKGIRLGDAELRQLRTLLLHP